MITRIRGAIATILALCCALQCHGFVDPSTVRFSYRYGICPASSPACGPIGGNLPLSTASSKEPSSPAQAKRLRFRNNTADGSRGFMLFAGEGEEELVQKVKEVVAEQLGADISKITPQSHFIKDLEADSLDSVELVMAFEEEFGVSIPDEEATKITTVQEAVDYIRKNKCA
ncbi:acyl carrier protein ACP [Cyclospora cayetanensis]|uniref:Acyl carrier protein n=1 Tax=Cyclospora cayetanensis TaxID=88456 RepID=A0A1D3D9E1_9EIME|nr:acyl carrier protein ACP [Cyclospora cayetanensis]